MEDLDRAAARAEQGLADLRAATDEAADSLAGRIERAGHLAEQRLEKPSPPRRPSPRPVAAHPPPAPNRRARVARRTSAPAPFQTRDSAFARFAERYGAKAAQQQPLSALAEAAARNDLILEDDEEAAPARNTVPRAVRRPPPADAAARIARLQALPGRGRRPPPQRHLAGRRRADFEGAAAPRRWRPSLMKMPRIMPLVAIAAGGVLAINAVENGPWHRRGRAQGFAEGVASPSPRCLAPPARCRPTPPPLLATSELSVVRRQARAGLRRERPTQHRRRKRRPLAGLSCR